MFRRIKLCTTLNIQKQFYYFGFQSVVNNGFQLYETNNYAKSFKITKKKY